MARKTVKDERREQILEGLFEAMAREGARGASVTEVAEAAGIARGALHYYFDSKDEIRAALMERLGASYLDGLEHASARATARYPDDASAVLRTLIRYHFTGDAERSERLLGVWIDYWGQAATDPRLNRVVLQVQERARELFVRALIQAQPDVAQLDAHAQRHLGAALLALVEGALLQWRVAARSAAPLARDLLSDHVRNAALAIATLQAQPARCPLPGRGEAATVASLAASDGAAAAE